MPETNISLGEFERLHGINKGTISKRARELGFTTSKGLSPEAYEAVKADFGVIEEVEAPVVSIESGNHCTAITPAEISGSIDLSQFRDSSSLVIDDPTSVADQFLAVADLLIQGLDKDAADREARLKQTRDARQQVSAKAAELQLEQRLYRERTRQSDTAQTQETQALQQALEQLQALGKPQGDS